MKRWIHASTAFGHVDISQLEDHGTLVDETGRVVGNYYRNKDYDDIYSFNSLEGNKSFLYDTEIVNIFNNEHWIPGPRLATNAQYRKCMLLGKPRSEYDSYDEHDWDKVKDEDISVMNSFLSLNGLPELD